MSLLPALLPTADWNGPGWWVVLFPLGWFVFFSALFFVLRRFGPWGCGYGPRGGRRGWRGSAGIALAQASTVRESSANSSS